MKEFSQIIELKELRERKSRISEREYELSKPSLEDFDLINDIFRWFCEYEGTTGVPERRKGAEFRQRFVFIVLMLYSPSTLAGGKMKIGVRNKITEVAGGTGTLISHSYKDVMFHYQTYKDYRHKIDAAYRHVVDKLKESGAL